MIYVYCPKLRPGALELINALDAKRLKYFDGLKFKANITFFPDDVIICWGTSLPTIDGVRILNCKDDPPADGEELYQWLSNVGSGAVNPVNRSNMYGDLGTPHPFLKGYYVPTSYKIYYEQDVTIHIFDKKIIKSGVWVPKPGLTMANSVKEWFGNRALVHPFVRCPEYGWTLSYENYESTPTLRKIAKQYMSSLGYDFAALQLSVGNGYTSIANIDLGPELDENGVKAYTKVISKWLMHEPEKEEAEKPVSVTTANEMLAAARRSDATRAARRARIVARVNAIAPPPVQVTAEDTPFTQVQYQARSWTRLDNGTRLWTPIPPPVIDTEE